MFFFLHICFTTCIFFINFRVEDIYNTQLSAKAVSKNDVLFFGFVHNSAVGCLNEDQPIHRQNIVSNCGYFLIFFSSYIFFQSLLFNFFFHIRRIHDVTYPNYQIKKEIILKLG